jgi:hypothetical protein
MWNITPEEILENNVNNYIRLMKNKWVECDRDFVKEQFITTNPDIKTTQNDKWEFSTTYTWHISPKKS